MTLPPALRSLLTRLLTLTDRLAPLAPALLRVTLGLVFIRSGWGKLHTLGDVTEFFASLHLPLPAFQARLVATTEIVGGAFVLVGLLTRLAALPLGFTMVIAILTAKLEEVQGLVDFAALDESAYLVMFVTLVLLGPGRWSVDAWLARKLGLSPHRKPSDTI